MEVRIRKSNSNEAEITYQIKVELHQLEVARERPTRIDRARQHVNNHKIDRSRIGTSKALNLEKERSPKFARGTAAITTKGIEKKGDWLNNKRGRPIYFKGF